MVILIKFLKRDITSGIRAWYWHLIVLTRSKINNSTPLEPEVEGLFVEEEEVVEEEVHSTETMTNKGNGYTAHDMAEKRKIPTEPFDGFTVVIPDHNTMQCKTWVPKLQVTVGNYTFVESFYVVDVADTNVVSKSAMVVLYRGAYSK